eukprot:CAMPEP_0195538922 /NCGR_PEP_ID=MMETSP0794_2-20130614/49786_1 /TAXON_ID=515487 /ORGANISM="Stephanopyxis turris, Strain CCMP 815" /LENGTH=115 /DNA_ID=CAMNT_0040672933 /DNA_START=80 /DNA_END=424 /DNA_ORIENTATION=-
MATTAPSSCGSSPSMMSLRSLELADQENEIHDLEELSHELDEISHKSEQEKDDKNGTQDRHEVDDRDKENEQQDEKDDGDKQDDSNPKVEFKRSMSGASVARDEGRMRKILIRVW